MSKRKGEVQGGKDGPFQGDGSAAETAMDTRRTATAAQMASRKIRQAKGPRRLASGASSSTGPSPFSSLIPSNPSPSVPGSQAAQLPSFAPATSQPNTPLFSFSASSQQPPTQQAPSTQAAANNQFSFGGAGQNFSFSPSSTGFSFSAPGSNNPFSTANGSFGSNSPAVNGFSGSIFNMPPANSPAESAPSQPSPSLFQFAPSTGAPAAPQPSPAQGYFGAVSQAPPIAGSMFAAPPPAVSLPAESPNGGDPDTTMLSASPEASPQKNRLAPDAPMSPTSPTEKVTSAQTGVTNNGLNATSVHNNGVNNNSLDNHNNTSLPSTTSIDSPPKGDIDTPPTIDAQQAATASKASDLPTSPPSSEPNDVDEQAVPAAPMPNAAEPIPSPPKSTELVPVIPETSNAVVARAPDVPPPPPGFNFGIEQQRQYETLYQMLSVDRWFKDRIARIPPGDDIPTVIDFYMRERARIRAGGYVPGTVAGTKRKQDDEHAPEDSDVQSKRSRLHEPRPATSPVTEPSNAGGLPTAAAQQPGRDLKRKADEPLSKDDEGDQATTKKAKASEPTPTAAGSKFQSQTSSLFSNILGQKSTQQGNASLSNMFAPQADVQQPSSQAPAGNAQAPATIFTAKPADSSSSPFKLANAGNLGGPSATSASNGASNDLKAASGTASPFLFKPAAASPPATEPVKSASNLAASLFSFKPAATPNASEAPKTSTGSFQFNSAASTSGPQTASTAQTSASSNLFAAKPAAAAGAAAAGSLFGTPAAATSAPTGSSLFKAPAVSSGLFNTPAPAAGPFSFKPAAPSNAATAAPDTSLPKPPKFGTGPVNFMAQFGKSVQENAEKEKEKRKAEDFDSEDEDEAEWERRDAEAQQAKKKELEEQAQATAAKYIPGKGFTFVSTGDKDKAKDDKQSPSETPTAKAPTFGQSTVLFAAAQPVTDKPAKIGASIFDQPRTPDSRKIRSDNIFGHLSDVESGGDSGKAGDADDEGTDTGEEAAADQAQPAQKEDQVKYPALSQDQNGGADSDSEGDFNKVLHKRWASAAKEKANQAADDASKDKPKDDEPKPAPSTGRSLFDRVSRPEDDPRPLPAPSDALASNVPTTAGEERRSIFGANAISSFGSGTSPFTSSTSPFGDNTWKANSPIKFGPASTAPTFSFTSPSPAKAAGDATSATPQKSLFGSVSPSGASPFGGGGSGSTTPAGKPSGVGFGFGGPSTFGGGVGGSTSFLNPSTSFPASNNTSRATSPGMTTDTGAESVNDEDDEASKQPQEQQIDLTASGPGEEGEQVLFCVRGRGSTLDTLDTGKMQWVTKGIGFLRVLKDGGASGRVRIVMRQDPSGQVMLNTALRKDVKYEVKGKDGKQLFFTVAAENGTLKSWIFQVRTNEDAKALAEILEREKGAL